MGVILCKTKLGSSSLALILVIGVFNNIARRNQGRKHASGTQKNYLIIVAL